jgi:hypothetical protein
LSVDELRRTLRLSGADAAQAAWERCRGVDLKPVRSVPPQSCTVTSWLASDVFRHLALKDAVGIGGSTVRVGSGDWCFEPHAAKGKSNATRARWIVLALCLDLEEKLCQHTLSFAQVPTKLTVSWQAPRERGDGGVPDWVNPGDASGTQARGSAAQRGSAQQSRTTPLAPRLFAGVTPSSELRRGVPYAQSGRADAAVISPATLIVEDPAQHTALLAQHTQGAGASEYAKRVASLVDAAAGVLHSWAMAMPEDQHIAQLTLNAHGFVPTPRSSPWAVGSLCSSSHDVTIPTTAPPATNRQQQRQQEGTGCSSVGGDCRRAEGASRGPSEEEASVEGRVGISGPRDVLIVPWDDEHGELSGGDGSDDDNCNGASDEDPHYDKDEEENGPRQTVDGGLHRTTAAAEGLLGGDWQCEQCTFLNSTLLPKCEMCDYPHASRVDTHTRSTLAASSDDLKDGLSPRGVKRNPKTPMAARAAPGNHSKRAKRISSPSGRRSASLRLEAFGFCVPR